MGDHFTMEGRKHGRMMSRTDYQDYQSIVQPFRWVEKKHLLILGVSLFVGLIFSRLLVSSLLHSDLEHRDTPIEASESPSRLHYAIMGDMGSSGTRIYVYTYSRSQNRNAMTCVLGKGGQYEGMQLMEGFEDATDRSGKVNKNEKKPGVSSFAYPPFEVGDYFDSMLFLAEDLIPPSQYAETPIFMFATAGLRALAEKQEERIFDDDDMDENAMLEQDDEDYARGDVSLTLNAIRERLHQSPFYFRDEHVRVLTGQEEATYDWIALQQKVNNGERNITKENDLPLDVGKQDNGIFPLGIIDTGGVSSQIAYSPRNPELGNARTNVFSETGSSIVAKSFLGYGMYESRAIYEGIIVQECLDDPHCDRGNMVNPCFSRGNTQKSYYKGMKYPVNGGGDFDVCYEGILSMFDLPGNCGEARCAIHGVPLPEPLPGTQFLAIDNVNRAANFFERQGPTSLRDIEQDVKEFCAMEWDDILVKYGPNPNEFRLKKYCYEGVYLLVLLHHGYGFPMGGDTPEIVFTDYLGGSHINWGMGAIASEIHKMCILDKLE